MDKVTRSVRSIERYGDLSDEGSQGIQNYAEASATGGGDFGAMLQSARQVMLSQHAIKATLSLNHGTTKKVLDEAR